MRRIRADLARKVIEFHISNMDSLDIGSDRYDVNLGVFDGMPYPEYINSDGDEVLYFDLGEASEALGKIGLFLYAEDETPEDLTGLCAMTIDGDSPYYNIQDVNGTWYATLYDGSVVLSAIGTTNVVYYNYIHSTNYGRAHIFLLKGSNKYNDFADSGYIS